MFIVILIIFVLIFHAIVVDATVWVQWHHRYQCWIWFVSRWWQKTTSNTVYVTMIFTADDYLSFVEQETLNPQQAIFYISIFSSRWKFPVQVVV
jgi:hypothetical protein